MKESLPKRRVFPLTVLRNTLQDLKDHDFTLSVNTYIEREEKETIDPEVVKQEFLDALSDVIKAEDKFKALLIKGGYINEQ